MPGFFVFTISRSEAYPESRATQRRLTHLQLAAITLENVVHHRGTDALPRVLGVQPLSPAQDTFALILGHTRAIILDTDLANTLSNARANAYLTKTQAVGILQQVT